MTNDYMCVEHNVLKLGLRRGIFSCSILFCFLIFFSVRGRGPMLKVAPMLRSTLAQHLSSDINAFVLKVLLGY